MTAHAAGRDRTGLDRELMAAFQAFFEDLRAAEALARDAGMPSHGLARGADTDSHRDSDPDDDAGRDSLEAPGVAPVRRQLVAAFERFNREGRRLLPRTAADAAEDAAFAAAVFADERLLQLSWAGRQAWLERPLEMELFNTRVGGERIFQRIDALGTGPGELALARIYLAMLNLGFGGRYDPEDVDDRAALDRYRERLFKLLQGRAPDPDSAAKAAVDTGRPAQSLGTIRFLPYVRPWIVAMVVVVLVFLGANHAIWRIHTADLAERVSALTQAMGY
jgi:type VI secretion system protein ImpK